MPGRYDASTKAKAIRLVREHRHRLPARARRPEADAEQLADDAEARGWISEADRHHRLIARLDDLIGKAQRPPSPGRNIRH
jgi:hypothetical protein